MKGSGKSTFINNFKRIDPEYFENSYKRMILIIDENFNHDFFWGGKPIFMNVTV